MKDEESMTVMEGTFIQQKPRILSTRKSDLHSLSFYCQLMPANNSVSVVSASRVSHLELNKFVPNRSHTKKRYNSQMIGKRVEHFFSLFLKETGSQWFIEAFCPQP